MNFSRRAIRLFTSATLCIAACGNALAHMPYVLPNVFDTVDRDHVSVTASFTETPFVPDVAMKSDSYAVIAPSGVKVAVTSINYIKDVATFEVSTTENGVYRITSGERLGRKSTMYKKPDGEWQFVEGKDKAPANVQIVGVQSVTTADAFVVRGKDITAVPKPSGNGVELQLTTAPNQIVANKPIVANVLFQGKPLANVEVEIFPSSFDSSSEPTPQTVKSDAKGQVKFTTNNAGAYLALIRHRIESPAGAETPWRSYSYTLTFLAK